MMNQTTNGQTTTSQTTTSQTTTSQTTTSPTTTSPTTTWSQLPFRPWINSVAISHDGSRVAGGTFIHDYHGKKTIPGYFETFAYDSSGTMLWRNKCSELDGVFAVGISGDGSTIASGGVFTQNDGFLKIFEGGKGQVVFDSTTAGSAPIVGRVNGIGVSDTGGLVAAAAGQLYVLINNGGQYTQAASASANDKDFETAIEKVSAVAVHPSGDWLAACNEKGQILVATLANQQITGVYVKTVSQEPLKWGDKDGKTAPVPFLSVAIAAGSNSFAVGGGDVVYYGTLEDMKAGKAPERYEAGDNDSPPGSDDDMFPQPNVRWVAISEDGERFSVVANRRHGDAGPRTGQLLLYNKGVFAAKDDDKKSLPLNPNSVSMDRYGKLVAVALGYPPGISASIYLFDGTGKQLWTHPTGDMNWPVAISADGTAIVAGGDDGSLLYFPTQKMEKNAPSDSLFATAQA
jgi:WD40 repeat protein